VDSKISWMVTRRVTWMGGTVAPGAAL